MSVYEITSKALNTNKSLELGHLAKLGSQAERALVREVTKNPVVTVTELQKSCAEMGETVRRTEAYDSLLGICQTAIKGV